MRGERAHLKAAIAEMLALPVPDLCSHDVPFAGRWINICAPGAIVTIDTEERTLRAGGNVTYGRTLTTARYTGRGWVARLHADAVAWLQQHAEVRHAAR